MRSPLQVSRRRVLAAAALVPAAAASAVATARESAANQWFPVTGDDGHPVPNLRAPAELVDDIEDLAGAIWAGPTSGSVKLVEFYDYNCPWCRAAERARDAVRARSGDLRIGLVGNPILSKASVEAARVDLAVLALGGAGASYALHRRLFELSGRIDGARALDVAAALGSGRDEVARRAASGEVDARLRAQMSLAASLGIVATPSYVVGGATVLGYPGERALAAIVDSARRCGLISC